MKLCADILYWRLKEELTGVLFYYIQKIQHRTIYKKMVFIFFFK